MLKVQVMDKALPILFLWDREYRAYWPNTYCQVSFNSSLINNKFTCDNFPKSVLWVGRWWTAYDTLWFNNVRYIKDKELENGNIIGVLAQVENIEEVIDIENIGAEEENNIFRLSIYTEKRVSISNISTALDGLHYGNYEPYDDLPLTNQEKKQALSYIEEIKDKYIVLKNLKPREVVELEFPVRLKSQTVEEYASIFSLKSINIYRDHNIDYLNELFVTQHVVLRLQSILLKLELLIEAMKKDR